ncbi:hypothetical protein JCM3263A_07350 [Thermobifida fusca]|uniref:cell division protein FtsQ/DivIB n=1 Tax=Thermobifida TaxID=83677 RepID=UPI00077C4848|nr:MULTISPECIES: FtsQ-type POTRA domain-containing protein [Thermobifida]MBO2528776.1 cell division protein FtsQ [Thermobifida sp.]MDD6791494.1 FtsQ-type POTRA domain-containing protein [Thermobifida fusca]PPS96026.1 cell division protein FtsQ [Thermobifida fusca]PZN60694.1 MAG: cell division protein FtsQ [Thermobifida fusca]
MTVEERSSAAVSDEGASRPDPWQAAFIILLVSGLVGAVLWVLFGSRLLAVRQIEVTGLDRLAETEVLAAVDVTPGTPLARVDTDAVAARVSELRLVDSVDVQRGWPATLRVAVTERVPVFALAAADGGYLLVDWEGVWVEKSEAEPEGYPLLHVSGDVEGNPAVADSALVLAALPDALAADVAAVVATDRARLTLEFTTGATAMWGDTERAADKARALEVLMAQHPPEPGRHYDVSAEGVAVVR